MYLALESNPKRLENYQKEKLAWREHNQSLAPE
jgi:hypothetical protein